MGAFPVPGRTETECGIPLKQERQGVETYAYPAFTPPCPTPARNQLEAAPC